MGNGRLHNQLPRLGCRGRSAGKRMRTWPILLIYVAVIGCGPASPKATPVPLRLTVRQPVLDENRSGNTDILQAAASYADRTKFYRDSTGSLVATKYGDPKLDHAVEFRN